MTTKIYRIALYVSGTISLVAAIIHVTWHWTLREVPLLQGMSPLQVETMRLMNAAVALLLTYLTLQTLFVARSTSLGLGAVRVFTVLLLAFWVGRFALEVVLPVKIPLLSADEPAITARLIMTLPVIVLCVPLVLEVSRRQG